MSKAKDRTVLGFRATPAEIEKMEKFKRLTGRSCSDMLRHCFAMAQLTGMPDMILVEPRGDDVITASVDHEA